jgi:hypothetical protein
MDGHAGGGPGELPGLPPVGPVAEELVTESLDYDGGRRVVPSPLAPHYLHRGRRLPCCAA